MGFFFAIRNFPTTFYFLGARIKFFLDSMFPFYGLHLRCKITLSFFFILERLFAKTTCSFSFLRAKYVFILLLTRALKNIHIYIVYTYIIHNTFFKKYIRIQNIKMYIYFNILVSLSMIVYVSQRFPPKWKFFFPSLVFNIQHMIAASAFLQYGKWVLRYLMELTN